MKTKKEINQLIQTYLKLKANEQYLYFEGDAPSLYAEEELIELGVTKARINKTKQTQGIFLYELQLFMENHPYGNKCLKQGQIPLPFKYWRILNKNLLKSK